MNERMARALPGFLLKILGRVFWNSIGRQAPAHEARQKAGRLHPYDWKIAYRAVDANTREVDILECAYIKLANDFDARGMLPGVCRMDYLFSHLMGNGFTRTKTLADGDECCNCRYQRKGACEWSPEKGFADRKLSACLQSPSQAGVFRFARLILALPYLIGSTHHWQRGSVCRIWKEYSNGQEQV